MCRNSGRGENVKQNVIRMLQALRMLAYEELSLEDKRVQAEWDNSGKKLQVTGKRQEKTARGSKTIKGTTLGDLVNLLEEYRKSKDSDEKILEEKLQTKDVQAVIDRLRDFELFTDKSKNKNRGYWIFDLSLKPDENIQQLIDSKWSKWNDCGQQPEPQQLEPSTISSFETRMTRIRGSAELSESNPTPRVTGPQPSENPEFKFADRYKQILFKRLLSLDFEVQEEQVQAAMKSRLIGSFMLHGQPGCGQEVLNNRLFQLIEGQPKRFKFPMISPTGKHPRRMWNCLTKQLEVSTDTKPEKIADFICQWRQTKDVLFTVDGVDCMLPELSSELLEKFWQKIVDISQEKKPYSAKPRRRLLMFLVDYEGNCHQNIPIVRDWNHPDYPRVPLLLEPARVFPLAVLDRWIRKAIKDSVIPEGLTAQMVLDASNQGIPEDVYKAICDHCDINWEGDLAQWLI